MCDKNFPWDGVAAMMAAVHTRDELSEFCGESIIDNEEWEHRYSAVSIARLDVTAVTVPYHIGCMPRELCEASGLSVLGVGEAEETGEWIVIVPGSGVTNRAAIEAMFREIDARVAADAAEAASVTSRLSCGNSESVSQVGSREFWNKLARFFARMSMEDDGLGIYSDLLIAGVSDELTSLADDTMVDESSEDSEGAVVRVGSGPAIRVVADHQSPPPSGDADMDAYRAFASIDSLGCTMLLFSADADALEDFETSAERTCQQFGLHLLGVCFIDDTLELLAIVSGTRQETEQKVGRLWQTTEGDPSRPCESAVPQ